MVDARAGLAVAMLALLWAGPTRAAECADNDLQILALAQAANFSGVTSCLSVASWCRDSVAGTYVRAACPAVCGVCAPSGECTGACGA